MTVDTHHLAAPILAPGQTASATPALWTPNITAILAFFLSPIFGGILVMKNWQAMGEVEKARQSLMWVYGTVALYVVQIVADLLMPDTPAFTWADRALTIGFFCAWYIVSCKDQKDVVAYRYDESFERRGWTKPLLIGVGIYAAFFITLMLLLMIGSPEESAAGF